MMNWYLTIIFQTPFLNNNLTYDVQIIHRLVSFPTYSLFHINNMLYFKVSLEVLFWKEESKNSPAWISKG